MTKPLSELKAGDEVILRDAGSGYRSRDTIEVIERTTKRWIILSEDTKFRISDGFPVGKVDPWNTCRIKPVTPELKQKIQLEEAFRRAKRNVRSLAEKVKTRCFERDNPAAAIPHLQAALAALETDPADNNAL